MELRYYSEMEKLKSVKAKGSKIDDVWHCETGPAYEALDSANRNFWLGGQFIYGPRHPVKEDWWKK